MKLIIPIIKAHNKSNISSIYLGRVVDVSPSLEQNPRDVLVPVVGGNMEGSEAGLAGHVRVVIVLQQQGGRLGVVLLGCDVEGWQPDLAPGVVLQQDGHHLVVTLLQSHGQGGEAVLRGEGLGGPAGQEEPHHLVVVLLGGHVERGEPVLGLDVDAGGVLDQDLHHLRLAGQAGDVEGGVALLGGRVDLGPPGQQVLDYHHMALLAGQVQGVQPVLKLGEMRNLTSGLCSALQ